MHVRAHTNTRVHGGIHTFSGRDGAGWGLGWVVLGGLKVASRKGAGKAGQSPSFDGHKEINKDWHGTNHTRQEC